MGDTERKGEVMAEVNDVLEDPGRPVDQEPVEIGPYDVMQLEASAEDGAAEETDREILARAYELQGMERARQARIAAGVEMQCRVCGCSDSRACDGGCVWAEPFLCSQCARKGERLVIVPVPEESGILFDFDPGFDDPMYPD